MGTFRDFRKLSWLALVALYACGPQGEVPRIIHPLHNISETAMKGRADQAAASQRTRPGLPAHCKSESRVKDSFCINCADGGIDIERCYAFRGSFDEARNCVYSADSIKCLSANPPFALKITRKASLEKSLVEHTRLWKESLQAIAKPSLSELQQQELDRALEKTERLVQVLVQANKGSDWITREFPGVNPALQKNIKQLQQSKESGHLKLQQVLQTSSMMLEASGTPAAVLGYWGALSVDGLEDSND